MKLHGSHNKQSHVTNGSWYIEWHDIYTIFIFQLILDITLGDTLLFASPTVVVGEPDNYVWFEFNGITTGTYDLSDMLGAYYRIEGEYWDFLTLSLTVNKYEDVGGDIEGTFAGTIENEAGTIQRVVYGGQFRVVRVANEAFIP